MSPNWAPVLWLVACAFVLVRGRAGLLPELAGLIAFQSVVIAFALWRGERVAARGNPSDIYLLAALANGVSWAVALARFAWTFCSRRTWRVARARLLACWSRQQLAFAVARTVLACALVAGAGYGSAIMAGICLLIVGMFQGPVRVETNDFMIFFGCSAAIAILVIAAWRARASPRGITLLLALVMCASATGVTFAAGSFFSGDLRAMTDLALLNEFRTELYWDEYVKPPLSELARRPADRFRSLEGAMHLLRPKAQELPALSLRLADLQREHYEFLGRNSDVIGFVATPYAGSPEADLLYVLVKRGEPSEARAWLADPRLNPQLREAIENVLAGKLPKALSK